MEVSRTSLGIGGLQTGLRVEVKAACMLVAISGMSTTMMFWQELLQTALHCVSDASASSLLVSCLHDGFLSRPAWSDVA